jgi:tetratricopeptide (TPR) repeat protein
MERAMDHNNQGVAHLEEGNYEQALLDVNIALQFLNSARRFLKEKNFPEIPASSSHSCRQAYKFISTQNAFVCSNAFLLDQSIEPMYSCVIESASVLLNMALCYHISSLEARSVSNSMSNAVKLYKMAYNLSTQCHSDSRRHDIIFTSLNNLGQLMHDMGEFDLSRVYLNELTCKVVRLLQTNEASAIDNGQDFLLNALVLKNPNICAPAA